MVNPRTRLAFMIATAIVFSSAAAAQQTSIRVSGDEPTSLRLPISMRAQAAASSGTVRFVVLGNVEPDRLGIARGVLRGQIVDASGPVGSSRLVHADSARPSGVVHVIAAGGGFTVLWGDERRFGPGLYARDFDRGGEPLAGERRVLPGPIVDLVAHPSHPALVTVLRRFAPPSLLLDGTVLDARPIDSARFSVPHLLRGDSSLVALVGDTVTLWRHFLDAEASLRRGLDVTDRLFPHAWTMTPGAAGGVVVTALRTNPMPVCFEWGAGVFLHQLVVDSALTTVDRSDIDSQSVCTSGSTYPDVTAAMRSWIDGAHSIRVVFTRSGKQPGQPAYSSAEGFDFVVSGCGGVARGTRHAATCRGAAPTIVRTSFDTMSAVTVDGARLASAIAPVQLGVGDRLPRSFTAAGEAHVAWLRGTPVPGAAWTDAARISRWTSDRVVSTDTIMLSSGQTSTQYQGYSTSTSFQTAMPQTDGAISLVSIGTGTIHVSPTQYSGSLGIWRATGSGWSQVRSGQFVQSVRYSEPLIGSDPNDGAGVTAVRSSTEGRLLYSSDTNGTSGASTVMPTTQASGIVPLSTGTWALAREGAIVRVQSTMVLDSIAIAPLSGQILWQREPGESLLHVALDTAAGALHVERYSTGLALIGAARFDIPRDAEDLSLAIDRDDSSLALLYATRSGVRLIHLARDLSLRNHNGLVFATTDSVANPTGVFLRGRLHVVWEDVRNGDADIYGRVLDAPFSGIVERRSEAVPLTLTVRPNPVSGLATIVLAGNVTSMTRLMLYDVLGNLVRDEDGGEETADDARSMVLDVSGLAPGMYMLSVKAGDGAVVRPIIVR